MSNYERTVFYIGVTSQIEWRILAHKKGEGCAFTSRYKIFDLIYYERFPSILHAIDREKQLKKWHREWKLNLVRKLNPDLLDLAADWYGD